MEPMNRIVASAEDAELRAPVAEHEPDRRRVGTDPERVLRLAGLVDGELDAVDEEVGEDRDDGQRADQRGEQGERHGEREGQEELADDAAHEPDRQEDGDRRQGARS